MVSNVVFIVCIIQNVIVFPALKRWHLGASSLMDETVTRVLRSKRPKFHDNRLSWPFLYLTLVHIQDPRATQTPTTADKPVAAI